MTYESWGYTNVQIIAGVTLESYLASLNLIISRTGATAKLNEIYIAATWCMVRMLVISVQDHRELMANDGVDSKDS